eukprot:15227649-Heterocapsa_arctica.AAC.1
MRNHWSPSQTAGDNAGPVKPFGPERPVIRLIIILARPLAETTGRFAGGADHGAFPGCIELDITSMPAAPSRG